MGPDIQILLMHKLHLYSFDLKEDIIYVLYVVGRHYNMIMPSSNSSLFCFGEARVEVKDKTNLVSVYNFHISLVDHSE